MAQFKRGALKTPRHKLLSLRPHQIVRAAPPQFTIVPPHLDMWDNDHDGDCVTAEEAFAKAWWSCYCGLPELFIPTPEVIRWASKYGFLNGAMLTDVMDVMQRDGFKVDGNNYLDGPYNGVDYSNEMILQNANFTGAVKVAIDANALPSGAGNQQGWYATSGQQYSNTDHCVAIGGYGRADYLFEQLRVALPGGLSPSTPGYHLYTWSTIGFVTHDWVMGTVTEAYVRIPGTPGQAPVPPGPPSPPSPPVPPVPPLPSLGSVTIPAQKLPDQSFSSGGFFGHTVTLPGQTVPGGTFPVLAQRQFQDCSFQSQVGTIAVQRFATVPWMQIVAILEKLVPVILADIQAGKTMPQILADVLAALAAQGHTAVAYRLTPAQWAQIIQMILQLLTGG